MITDYHRPKTLDEALALLAQPNTFPLGGGTLLSHGTTDSVQAIDLQLLGLNSLTKSGNNLELGATLTLQSLLESAYCPEPLKAGIKLEAPLNIRNAATIAGTLVTCDGRSTFTGMLLAADAKITVIDSQKTEETINIGGFLPLREQAHRKLITKIIIPANIKLAFEYVSRTPSDKPIVYVALAQWNSGRVRFALGGYGKAPMLAMDGLTSDDLQTAARNTFHEANDDFASAEYRMEIASTLVKRCLADMAS